MADKEEVESVYWEEKSKGEAFKECCAREYHPYKKVSFLKFLAFFTILDTPFEMDPVVPS